MNKIAIISDIHGNLPALNAVLADIKERGITSIYCLGDLVGYYCFHNEVVDRIATMKIPTVLGNHDDALINNFGVIERSKTCTNILKWQLANASIETLSYLKTLPKSLSFEIGQRKVKIVHAGLIDNVDEYVFNVDENYFITNAFEEDVLISGHTHLIAYKSFYSGKIWLNPGSVGQPRDKNNKASYLILDEGLTPDFIRVSYNFDSVIEAMRDNGFDAYISEGLRDGKKIA